MKVIKPLSLIILFFSFLALTSCSSGELTRPKAKEMIQEKHGYPKQVVGELPLVGRLSADDKDAWMRIFTESGLVTYSFGDRHGAVPGQLNLIGTWGAYFPITGSLTEKGEKYLIRRTKDEGGAIVEVATLFVDRVTGIKKAGSKTRALVEYTVKANDLTPFAHAFSRFSWKQQRVIFQYPSNSIEEVAHKKAYFEKYDDGWRIK